MAITIQDQPSSDYVYPAYSPIEYLVSSTSTSESGFKIICKVYKGATLISTQQINIRPLSTQAVLSIQDVAKSFVSSQYSLLDGDSVGIQSEDISSFSVVFQEYYDGELQGNTETSNIVSVWNASPKYIEWANLSGGTKGYEDWSIADYFAETGKEFLNGFEQQAEWFNLSAANNFLKVRTEQKYQASWIMRENLSDTYKIYLKTLDSTFTNILSTTMTAPNTAGLYTLDVGASEVASHSWATTPVMTNVKYYALRILNFTEDVWATKTMMFEIDDCNNGYTDYELHWLNRKGGYDSFTFSGKSNQTTSINKTFAKYNTRTIGASSITHNTYAQRKRAFNTSLSDSYRLSSRLLKDFEVEGLEDLFSSPEVYWKYGANFVAVNVTGSTFEHAKSENGKVYSIDVSMEVDNSDKRQW